MTWFRNLSRTALAGLIAFIWIAGNVIYIAAMHLLCSAGAC